MNRLLPSRFFLSELAGWTLRVGACAVWSFCCAYQSGFNSFAAVTGMLAGIAAWALAITWYCERRMRRLESEDFYLVRALKLAVFLKSGPTLIAFVGVLLWTALFPGRHSPLVNLAFVPEMITSAAAYVLANPVVRWAHLGVLDGRDEFAWTALATVVNGALIAVLVAVIAAPVRVLLRETSPEFEDVAENAPTESPE